MYFRIIIAFVLFVVSVGNCAAEQPSVRIDLAAPRPVDSFVAIPFVFEDSNLDCPEDRRTLTVSKGVLKIFYLFLPRFEEPIFPTKEKFDPIDDSTYRLQLLRPNCRMDIDIRQQVRSDDGWKSLLVMEERRPSLSEEARQEAVNRRLEPFRKRLAEAPKGKPMSIDDTNESLRAKGPKRWGWGSSSWPLPFDEAPNPCMDVFGEYRITRNGFTVAFFTPLAGDLNKFLMEGSDLDLTHARIYLTKDDCRFEFTISQSVLSDGQWTALPLRPVSEDKKPKPAESNR